MNIPNYLLITIIILGCILLLFGALSPLLIQPSLFEYDKNKLKKAALISSISLWLGFIFTFVSIGIKMKIEIDMILGACIFFTIILIEIIGKILKK
jgi:hypothetical protein